MQCTWIFKRGKRKGQKCDAVGCKRHKQKLPPPPLILERVEQPIQMPKVIFEGTKYRWHNATRILFTLEMVAVKWIPDLDEGVAAPLTDELKEWCKQNNLATE